MRKGNALFLIGLVLLIAGAAVLVYGIISYNNASNALGPALSKALTGSSKEEKEAVTFMLVGGGGALLGLVLLIAGRRRR